MTITHHVGQVLDVVRDLPDASVDLVATSPPFLALRDYNGLPGQWGHEPDPATFLDRLLQLTTELRRVLTPHGSIAVELGDTYSGSGGGGGDYLSGGFREGQPAFSGSAKYAAKNPRPSRAGTTRRARRRDQAEGILPADRRPGPDRRDDIDGWPLAKSLCLTPTLFTASLAYGRNLLNPDHEIDRWRIRNMICWARSNPMPGALADKYRPAVSYITVATVAGDRWFDLDAVRGPGSPNTNPRIPATATSRPRRGKVAPDTSYQSMPEVHTDGSPPLDYWTDEHSDGDIAWLLNTVGSGLAHYAMWPPTLAERLILSMCPAQVCRTCGDAPRRLTASEYVDRNGHVDETAGGRSFVDHSGPKHIQGKRLAPGEPHLRSRTSTLGWTDCGHDDYRPGVVLDPFAGTGTTLAVADLWGRDAIGIDLDPANTELHAARAAEVKKALFGVKPPAPGQTQLELLA